jgi:NAD(P)H dehydrogenase (quinone)
MSNPLFLMTGATGETGNYSIQLLRNRGRNVRALVHEEDERADRLRSLGAEAFSG